MLTDIDANVESVCVGGILGDLKRDDVGRLGDTDANVGTKRLRMA